MLTERTAALWAVYGHFSVKTTRQTTLHTAFKVVVEVVIKANMCGWCCCGYSLSDCVVVGIDSFRFSDSVTLMTIPDKLRNSNHDIEG